MKWTEENAMKYTNVNARDRSFQTLTIQTHAKGLMTGSVQPPVRAMKLLLCVAFLHLDAIWFHFGTVGSRTRDNIYGLWTVNDIV